MNKSKNLDEVYEKLKLSPHWRDDFRIEETKDAGGIPVYYIKADDQEPSTILAIAQLNEVLKL
ncbi:hypothetical protein WG219_12940 [Ectopseudomonas mendocina]|uniref:Uncharacterized protein n=1 Tax=Ectopseudomonas mendocina TaxID=300 RepID=A0ABZ2RB30_ECTME